MSDDLVKLDTEDDTNPQQAPEDSEVEGSDVPAGTPTPAPSNTAFVQDEFDKQAEAARAANPETGVEVKEREFVIVQHTDPARQRDPNGIYLDDVIRRDAETQRARIEGREPDYENPGTTASDVVQPVETVQKELVAGAVIPVAFTQKVPVGSPSVSPENYKPGVEDVDKSYYDELAGGDNTTTQDSDDE